MDVQYYTHIANNYESTCLQRSSGSGIRWKRSFWYFGLKYVLEVLHSDPKFIDAVLEFDPDVDPREGGFAESFYFSALDKACQGKWSSSRKSGTRDEDLASKLARLSVGIYCVGAAISLV